MGLHKPVMAVPKSAIEDISKVKIHRASFFKMKNMKEHEKVLFKYMFEVYLRKDYEDVYRFRDEEENAKAANTRRRSRESRSINSSVLTTKTRENSFIKELKVKKERSLENRSLKRSGSQSSFKSALYSNYSKKS